MTMEEDTMETTMTWYPPDGSFSKQILLNSNVPYGPEDGCICIVSMEITNLEELREPLDVSCIGYPLGESMSIQIGEGDTDISQTLDKCILSMKTGEVSVFTFSGSVRFNNQGIEQRELMFRIELNTLVEIECKTLCQLTCYEKFQRAQHHKDKGTHLFKAGTIVQAFKRFSKSLQYLILMFPERTIPDEIFFDYKQLKCHCYLNLAACQLRYGGFNHAIINCTKALELDSKCVKAFYRRAQCHIELGDLQEAADDLVTASNMEPENSALQQLLHTVQTQFQRQNQRLASGLSKMFT